MKIAIEARPIMWSYGTGIGNYTNSLIKNLALIDRDNAYTFLWPVPETRSVTIPFNREYTFYQIPKDDHREEREIPAWLSGEKADIFHLTQNGFRIPKKATSCKIIVTIHDLIPYFLPEVVRPSFLKRFLEEMPLIVERADHIITVSETSKNDLIKVFGLAPQKISVIFSAPAEIYQPLAADLVQEKLRKQYNIHNPYLLYAGGLNPRKNVRELIIAYAKLYRSLPKQQQLVIIGPEGKHLNDLRLLGKALGIEKDLIFPGFIPSEDLPYFYNGADLFVYPSLYEGFGLPPIEAMSCGTPVIVSNVSSLPEIAGSAALQVSPHDTLQLAEQILQLLTDPDRQNALIAKGFQQSQKYQWPIIATEILALYQSQFFQKA